LIKTFILSKVGHYFAYKCKGRLLWKEESRFIGVLEILFMGDHTDVCVVCRFRMGFRYINLGKFNGVRKYVCGARGI